MKILKFIVFILMIPVFLYSFFSVSWTGSNIMLEEDWKSLIVFTPQTAATPQEIYDIDKLLYAFQYQPLMSGAFVVSFLFLMGCIVFWMIKRLRRRGSRTV
ncbi:DUF4306 domain-containing protein [Bacillus sp. KH172YL63]|uniref:DUF4306 domain-containing protein n=1 Tax=Bacillus sp. KH172YL63 TaxID=2709784 RepID=UPI001563C093|nr:DUF4306 domain-containing protein [Bacillus sp. KH172YL63]